MPKITLSKHALQRARSRKMESYAIEQLILFPDQKTQLEDDKINHPAAEPSGYELKHEFLGK